MIFKKIFMYVLLFVATFLVISLTAFPILFDLIFCIFIFILFRKNIFSIVVLNLLVITMVFVIDLTFGKNEEHGFFYRAHEKYSTKEKKYKPNISDTIYMRFGDLYFIDGGLDSKREKIVEPRVQYFKTDVHGLRNDRSTIENSDYILVGDSFISGQGTSQEDIPANILSDIINKKVATLSWAGNSPKDYEELIKNYLPKIKKNSKIFVFYFEGNDFKKKAINFEKITNEENIIFWRGYSIPKWKATIRFAYERLERNKDKYLLKVFSEKNYFLRNIRSKTHLFNRKVLTTWTGTGSPIYYKMIKNNLVGFNYELLNENDYTFSTYIPNDPNVIDRINAVFYIPTKASIYSKFLNNTSKKTNKRLNILKDSFNSLNIPVYDLSEEMINNVPKYLLKNEYLFWRDDSHWNKNGIHVAMKFISKKLNLVNE